MAKIQAIRMGEIVRLYILSTLFMTVFSLIVTLPVEYGVMAYIL